MAAPDADASADRLRATLERGLQPQYRILRLLGRGGMGAVYLAREEALERLVAVKALTAATPEGEERERFRREARTAARLNHPGIVPLHGFGEVEGTLYLVMGYVRGETLAARLKREGRIEPGEARRMLADLAEALDYAHRQGVVHRDVKPDNIMIDDESGRALLTDFGVAKAHGAGETMTQAGALVGTPQFMSPEQCAGRGLDGRSDIYSLGLTAYAMLAGHPPFEGPTPQEALVRRLVEEAPPLRQVAPHVDEDLARAVMRCLAREPEERWPDGRSLRDAVAPRSLEEEELPEPLDVLDGTAAFLLPFLLLCAFGAWGLWCHSGWVERGGTRRLALPSDRASGIFFIVGAAVTALQIPTLLTASRLARRRGFTAAQVATAVCRQPRWWICLWYPRRFRRPGDVWDRLPAPFQAWRMAATALVAMALPFLALTMYVGSPRLLALQGGPVHDTIAQAMSLSWMAVLTTAVAAAITQVPCARFMRRRGLDTYTLRRVSRALLIAPTSDRSIWKKPELAKVLLSPPSGAAALPRTPADYLAALSQAGRELSGLARDLAHEAAAAARAMLAELTELDREIGRLEREADPAEAARLDARLARADDEAGASEERLQMRRLIEQQRELLGRLALRLAEARARRERLLEGLHELWTGVAALLRSQGTADADTAVRLRARWAELHEEAEPGAGPATLTRAR